MDTSNNFRSGPSFKINIKYILITLLLCLISFLLARSIFHSSEKKVITPKSTNRFVYKTAIVSYINEDNIVEAMGKVTYNENNIVRVYPIVSGKISDVKVSLGSYVKKGQELAHIVSADVSDLIKEFNISKTNVALAKKNLTIADSLFKSKFNSELDLLNATNEYKKANDEFTKIKAVLHLYNINPKNIQPIYSIKSSIDGYVVDKNITNTMLIRPDNGTSLFTISNLETVWVYANIFEDNITKIKTGQKVTIHPLAYDYDLTGTVDNISAILDKESRILKVRSVIENKQGILKPEMAVTIKIHIPKETKYLAVLPQSVIFDKENYFVLVIRNKKIIIRKVELAHKTSHYSFLKNGIKEGDTIVTEGSLLLYNQLANEL